MFNVHIISFLTVRVLFL